MNKTIKFSLKVMLVILLVVALIIPINILYINGETYNGAQAGMEKFESVPSGIKYANFGPSYGMSCFDYEEFEKDGNVCFNFALTMQDLYHDWQIYKKYKDNFEKGAVIAITVSYFSFCQNTSSPSSARYYKILDKNAIKGYTLENDLSASFLPVYGKGSALIRDLTNDAINAIMNKGINSTEEQSENETQNSYSDSEKAIDLKNDSSVRVLTIESGNLLAYDNCIPELEGILISWIEEMKADGLNPILVLTPYWKDYSVGFDTELLDKCYIKPISRVIEQTEVEYINFNTAEYESYITNPLYFSNCDHVSSDGTKEFMRLYTDYIKKAR